MAKGFEVLTMLRPEGGWIIVEDNFDSIQWIECEPLTREEFEEGFLQYDDWKLAKDQEKELKKAAAIQKLADLGLTVEDIKSVLEQ